MMNRQQRDDLLSQLRRDAARIAQHFGLSYREICAERAGVTSRYGACYADGRITIRLNHAKTGEPLRYSSLVDTLCHELAHLKHFDHSPAFRQYFWKLLSWARREGIYRPERRRNSATDHRGTSSPTLVLAAKAPARQKQRSVPFTAAPPSVWQVMRQQMREERRQQTLTAALGHRSAASSAHPSEDAQPSHTPPSTPHIPTPSAPSAHPTQLSLF